MVSDKKKGAAGICIIQHMLDSNELQGEKLERIVRSNWQITIALILNAKPEGMFFNEILSESGLTARTLSSVLKSLEAEKMLSRMVVDSHPIRVKYALTGVGKKLASSGCPIIVAGMQG
jgi:DNA-binding HxlR family transcriptional regulator